MTDQEKQRAFAMLKELGATKAVCGYSGGYDSGGVDSIELFNGDKSLGQLSSENRELMTLLESPVYETYYSFAGEYSAAGTVIWDVKEQTVVLDGEESVQQSESRYQEF